MRCALLLAAATACGDGIAGPDASVPVDAPHDLVTVQVRSRYVREGSRVFFQRPDSTLVLATTTDGSGRVQAYIPPHTMITVELTDNSVLGNRARTLYTQFDVNPGDEVVLDDGSLTKSTTLFVQIPADEGGSSYTLHAPCDAFKSTDGGLEPDVPAQFQLTGCDTIGDLLVTSDSTGRFLYLPHVALAASANVQFTGPYQPAEELSVRVDNVPPSLQRMRAQIAPLDGVHELANVVPQLELVLDGFTSSKTVSWPAPVWDAQRVLVRLTSDDFTQSVPSVYAWGPTAAPTEIDFGTDLPRAYLTTPRYIPESNRVGWLEADQGRLADAVFVELRWFSDWNITWRIFARRDERTWVTVPVLPDPDLVPANAFVSSVTNIAIDGGYERLRELPLLGQLGDVRATSFPVSAWPMDTPTGRVTFQSLGSVGPIERVTRSR